MGSLAGEFIIGAIAGAAFTDRQFAIVRDLRDFIAAERSAVLCVRWTDGRAWARRFDGHHGTPGKTFIIIGLTVNAADRIKNLGANTGHWFFTNAAAPTLIIESLKPWLAVKIEVLASVAETTLVR